jgi:phosphoglycerate dehydrogenase-like enzyme
MVRALIPYREGLGLLGELPGDAIVEVWDGGSGEPPAGVTFWVPGWIPIDNYPELIAALPDLQVIQLLSAGYEHVLDHVPPGVTLCNARGVHDPAVAEWVLAAVLAVLRDLPRHIRRPGARRSDEDESDTLFGKTVLILGYGSIGHAVERCLAPFEVELLKVASRARDGVHGPEALAELLPRTELLVILVPRNEETIGMVDAAALAALPDGALVVNAARGGIVDEVALLAELHSGRLRAALDVAEPDPLPADHPLLAEPGLLYTPHVAGATRQTLPRVFGFVGDQLRRYLRGEPLHNVVTESVR